MECNFVSRVLGQFGEPGFVLDTVRSSSPSTVKPGWRLLVTEACDGATNMAIDEAVWRGRQAGTSPPTIRFYAWDPPTVSLGYGQHPGDDISAAACRRFGVGIVRRPTGG